MLITQILMRIFATYENERTISAAFHIVQGKRSGTTIQDVGLYKLFAYFGILKKFPRQTFDHIVNEMQQQQLIEVYENGFFAVLPNGKQLANEPFTYYFDGWHFRGNEHIFFARLSLVIQALSYQAEGYKSFAPMTRDEEVQQFSRKFLTFHQFHKTPLQQPFLQELLSCLEEAQLSELQREIFTKRLHGAKVFGYTWSQLAEQHEVDLLSCQLYFISALHTMLHYIEQHSLPMLQQLMHGVKVTNVLTDSTQYTADLFMKGHSLEEIAHIRRLKMSTIEDHIVEFAMYEPTLNIEYFISQNDCQQVLATVDNYMTKKLKVLKEAVPHLTYFQIKLALTKEGIK